MNTPDLIVFYKVCRFLYIALRRVQGFQRPAARVPGLCWEEGLESPQQRHFACNPGKISARNQHDQNRYLQEIDPEIAIFKNRYFKNLQVHLQAQKKALPFISGEDQ